MGPANRRCGAAAVACPFPGLRKLVFNLVDGAETCDGIAELWCDSQAARDAASASEIGQKVVACSLAHLGRSVRLVVADHPQFG